MPNKTIPPVRLAVLQSERAIDRRSALLTLAGACIAACAAPASGDGGNTTDAPNGDATGATDALDAGTDEVNAKDTPAVCAPLPVDAGVLDDYAPDSWSLIAATNSTTGRTVNLIIGRDTD